MLRGQAQPVANFKADVTSGCSPIIVSFKDLSTGDSIYAWSWDFGNGSTSTLQNPYGANAVTKFKPLGVPTPVTLSQPGPVVSELSVPKVMTNQRVENGLL